MKIILHIILSSAILLFISCDRAKSKELNSSFKVIFSSSEWKAKGSSTKNNGEPSVRQSMLVDLLARLQKDIRVSSQEEMIVLLSEPANSFSNDSLNELFKSRFEKECKNIFAYDLGESFKAKPHNQYLLACELNEGTLVFDSHL